ncbi:MAG: ABC transporter ATP-binding protein [Coprococcus sp.]
MIEIRHLYKAFDRHMVLRDLNMKIEDGAIYGFVGPNGAGKTTTMRIIAGLLKADSGQILFDGVDIGNRRKDVIGYMPDFFGVYDRLKVKEYMSFFSSIYGLDHEETEKRTNELLELVHLQDRKESYVDTLSRGMKQRLCLARCLIHDPKLLILDEPASGLDPRARFEFKEIIRHLWQQGHTILISSHILPELSEMCTDICIIDHGKCIMDGSVEEIEHHMLTAAPLVVKTMEKMQEAIELIRENPLVETLSYSESEIRAVFNGGREDEVMLLRRLMASDIPVYTFKRDNGNLETLFMQITDPEVKKDAYKSGI